MPRFAVIPRIVMGVILLALASALSLVVIPRWVPLADVSLALPGLATLGEADSPWQPVGRGAIEPLEDGVRIVNTDPDGVAGVDLVLPQPPAARAFRLSATVTLEDVVAGAERWQRPRILVQNEVRGRRPYLHGPHQLIDQGGDFGPERLTGDFPVSPDHDAARLMIRLHHATGILEVRDLEVVPLEKPAARVILRYVLIGVWLVTGTGLAAFLWWQSHNRAAASFVVAALAMTLIVVVFPNEIRTPIHGLLRQLAGGDRLLLVKPLVHFLGFGALALASRLALPDWPLWVIAPGWLAAAVLLELAELRYGRFEADDLVDMGCNAAGVVVGLAIAWLWLRRRSGRRTLDVAPDARHQTATRRP